MLLREFFWSDASEKEIEQPAEKKIIKRIGSKEETHLIFIERKEYSLAVTRHE
jgi:hypothetical protein